MPTITLPDNSQRQFDQAVTVYDVALSIGEGLARAAIAGKVDQQLVDTHFVIEKDVTLALITSKDVEALEIVRHSCAHLMAQAVKQLYPTAQVTIGPVIEDGFYYDYSYDTPFTPEDLKKIQKRMKELAKQNLEIKRLEMTRDEAVAFFEGLGEHYKVELIKAIPEDQVLSLYQQGDFTDLCRGPHVPRTGMLKVFSLMKLAGAYWRGDSNNEMLQRIYGTAWLNKTDLADYLHRLEEAQKRDHRKIAKQLDLFHLNELAPGMVFWHHNGYVIYRELETLIREMLRKYQYQEIKTPQIVDSKLWHQSGHWENYGEHMFSTESENRHYAIKPMSCPCHVLIFNQGIKSYRDLPLRLAEFGCCHRNEYSGALHGLMRVRGFVQDDAHIFCTPSQVQDEVLSCVNMLHEIYKVFGFTDIIIGLSTRPEKRVGTDELWDRAEGDLATALDAAGLEWKEQPGDGAFYGPKIDFSLKDCLGRVWQTCTLQLDYCLPERLGAHYVSEDGSKQTPVMVHRAIFGSIERFMGILIEEYAGKFPLWLAPIQVVVLNITGKQAPYCQEITTILQKEGIRAISDLRNEKIGYKIREHTLQRVPYQVIIGDKELDEKAITVRTREGSDLGCMQLDSFIEKLNKAIDHRVINLMERD
jgi:threonyl-tRNA synthetase